MVTYDLKTEIDSTHVTKGSEYEEHRALVKTAVENQRIVLNGETLDIHDDNNTNFAISENSSKGVNDLLKPQIFMLFTSKDEIEPHDFL